LHKGLEPVFPGHCGPSSEGGLPRLQTAASGPLALYTSADKGWISERYEDRKRPSDRRPGGATGSGLS